MIERDGEGSLRDLPACRAADERSCATGVERSRSSQGTSGS